MAATRPTSPGPDERARAQRARILKAAHQSFAESGFHAASMADISVRAGMSPGLIYRYFENKSAIIQAIVQQQLDLARERVRMSCDIDLTQKMIDEFGREPTEEHAGMNPALLLELSAEATRDSQIAAAVQTFDRELRSLLVEWMSRRGEAPPSTDDRAHARALMLQIIFEGLRMRESREPGLDRGLLAAALRQCLPALLGEPPFPETSA
jgi:AcrR family transcriptional regulator